MVLRSLRIWFLVHFWVDYAFAVPLFLFPRGTLALLGWVTVDPVATRIVAAALFAIGGVSLISRNTGRETHKHLLNLKLIWSFAAIVGLLLAMTQDTKPLGIIPALVLFIAFGGVWFYYRLRLRAFYG